MSFTNFPDTVIFVRLCVLIVNLNMTKPSVFKLLEVLLPDYESLWIFYSDYYDYISYFRF